MIAMSYLEMDAMTYDYSLGSWILQLPFFVNAIVGDLIYNDIYEDYEEGYTATLPSTCGTTASSSASVTRRFVTLWVSLHVLSRLPCPSHVLDQLHNLQQERRCS